MSSMQFLFAIISGLGLLLALGTVVARNLVRAALYLVGFFFIIACQFVLLEAEFLAVVQVLVYIGAVAILMMFGIMLTRNIQGDETTTVQGIWKFAAGLAGLGVLAVLVLAINDQVGLPGQPTWREVQARTPVPEPLPDGTRPLMNQAINDQSRLVGVELMTRFVIPFEVAGLLLTVAIVGAVALAYQEEPERPTDRRQAIPTVLPRSTRNGPGDGRTAAPARAPAGSTPTDSNPPPPQATEPASPPR